MYFTKFTNSEKGPRPVTLGMLSRHKMAASILIDAYMIKHIDAQMNKKSWGFLVV